MKQDILNSLITKNDAKIVYVIMDGLGGLPRQAGGLTELETAKTPNMDRLAKEGMLGLLDPIGQGITPGSGPAHLALFGYDPIEKNVGRGILSALGVDFPVTGKDVCARLNFCTLDEKGNVTDRRAGRIATEVNERLCKKLIEGITLSDGIEFFMKTESEHRALLVIRGDGLGGNIHDTDSQKTGVPPLLAKGVDAPSEKAAKYVNEFLSKARQVLKNDAPANFILARGFAKHEPLPTMEEMFGLKSAAIAQYPMYRGLARLVGMAVLPRPESYEAMYNQLAENYNEFNFFFIHFKKTDSYGEDGNFDAKVKVIEEVDAWVKKLDALNPDVLVITGDHSTPAIMKAHSWHPVPALFHCRNGLIRPDLTSAFGETECARGGLLRMPMNNIILEALATTGKIMKFGA
ncbi:MAG: 2,3-bisphosphoglycerate-independent phosphoglycerate mutase [Calditrichales bacterium]|nr:MAG: 2,3-bisphosphoglycerate-independent phosphoglycerate mutase [Calditrichales bacterium]